MSDWFTYNWPLHDRIATFRVDRSCAARLDLLGDQSVLIHVTCAPGDRNASSFSHPERRRLSAFSERCAECIGESGVYAGSIEVGPQVRYYFYTPDARALVPIYNLCTSEKLLSVSCAKANEPKKQTYYRLLLPDAAKYQAEDNKKLIADRKAKGDDLSAYRRISLHFSFPSVSAMDAFRASAREDGFALGESRFLTERDFPHLTSLYAVSVLEWEKLTDLTARSIRLAEDAGGRFLSMEAAVVERKR